jgi:hypothetical protein
MTYDDDRYDDLERLHGSEAAENAIQEDFLRMVDWMRRNPSRKTRERMLGMLLWSDTLLGHYDTRRRNSRGTERLAKG